jgi:hypothetical protein
MIIEVCEVFRVATGQSSARDAAMDRRGGGLRARAPAVADRNSRCASSSRPRRTAGGLFAICHGAGDNAAGDQDGTGKPPLPRSPCVLCTLTSAACAVLPTDHSIAFIDAKSFSDVFPWNDARMIQYDSPTGQYQTGPPARARISG